MKCGGCAAGVKRRLLERPEVHSAAVNLVTGSAVVALHTPAATSLAADLSELLTSQVGSPNTPPPPPPPTHADDVPNRGAHHLRSCQRSRPNCKQYRWRASVDLGSSLGVWAKV